MILALQYSAGDSSRAMRLARLLADLEKKRRSDVLLAFVSDRSTPETSEIESTYEYCGGIFDTMKVRLPWSISGWPRGPNHLWAGAMMVFSALCKVEEVPHRSIFTFDGGDGVPLHNNWIDLLRDEHAQTIKDGKLITAAPGIDSLGRSHINGNMIADTGIWDLIPTSRFCPSDEGWDCQLSLPAEPLTAMNTVFRNDWRKNGLNHRMFLQYAPHHIWWHGHKSPDLCVLAREYLLKTLGGQCTYPTITRWENFGDYRTWRSDPKSPEVLK